MSFLNPNDLQQIFEKLDQNGDGFVSLNELKCLLETIGILGSPDELESPVGKTGLDLPDFLCFYETVNKQNISDQSEGGEGEDLESDLARAFEVYDLNGDSFISCEELQSVLLRLGLWKEHSSKNCYGMINKYDTKLMGCLISRNSRA